MTKKNEVKMVKHTLTEEDFKINPELEKEGLKVGDEIEIPEVPESKEDKKDKETKPKSEAKKDKTAPKKDKDDDKKDKKEKKHKLVGKKYRKQVIIKAKDILINGIVRTQIDLNGEVITLGDDDAQYIN